MLTLLPVKIIVILITLGLTGVAIWGNVELKQKFDPTWFIPPGTYLADFFLKNRQYFPFGGFRVTVYCHDVELPLDYKSLSILAKELQVRVRLFFMQFEAVSNDTVLLRSPVIEVPETKQN